jgi:hypothetical protein
MYLLGVLWPPLGFFFLLLTAAACHLQEGLYAQEVSGLWSKTGVVCSSGE